MRFSISYWVAQERVEAMEAMGEIAAHKIVICLFLVLLMTVK